MTNVLVPVRPDDPPFMNPMAARNHADNNPRRWAIPWSQDETSMDYARQAFWRTDANGEPCRRLILEPERRSLDGAVWPGQAEIGHMGVGMGAGWESIDPFKKQVIIDLTLERRAEDRAAGRPELTVGFYTNAVSNGMPGVISNHTSTDVPNLDNDADLDRFKRNWLPWIECGVLSELNYDAGTHNHLWPKVKNLIEDCMARFGLYCMTEAIRWDSKTGSVYNWAPWQGAPMWCLSRYILNRDPGGLLEWEPPAKVWVMNHTHERSPGVSGLLSEAEVRDFKARGWGVGSWLPPADYAVNLPTGPTPVPAAEGGA